MLIQRGKMLNCIMSVFRCHVNTSHWTQWRSGLFVSTVETDLDLLMITSGPVYSVIYSSLLSLSSWFHPVPFGAEQRCSSVAFVEAGSAELHLPLSVQGWSLPHPQGRRGPVCEYQRVRASRGEDVHEQTICFCLFKSFLLHENLKYS